MIYTAFYYPGSLDKGDLIVRDNRFYPGKYIETFPVWYQYVRKNYPEENIHIFYDVNSPYPLDMDILNDRKITVELLREHSGKYFWTMQRNICEGLIHAYEHENDFFWLDNDAFLNTDLRPIFKECDVFAPVINHQQFTIDSVCTYISKNRLRGLDGIFYLNSYLRNILNYAPNDVRAHTFQEGGLYKMFCYGNVKSSTNLNISHLSNYNNFMKFLLKNPLNSKEYHDLVDKLTLVRMDERLKDVQLDFLDMYYEEVS